MGKKPQRLTYYNDCIIIVYYNIDIIIIISCNKYYYNHKTYFI